MVKLTSITPPVRNFHGYHFFLSIQQAKFDIQSKYKALQSEHEQLQETHDEEMDSKSSLQSQMTSAKSEVATWKNKFETEATPRIEELEEAKWVHDIHSGNVLSVTSIIIVS